MVILDLFLKILEFLEQVRDFADFLGTTDMGTAVAGLVGYQLFLGVGYSALVSAMLTSIMTLTLHMIFISLWL